MGNFQNYYNKTQPIERPKRALCPEIYRPGTDAKEQKVNFVLTRGGIGDWLCWFNALKFIEDKHWQVKGTIYAPNYMLEILEWFFKPKWKIKDRDTFTTEETKRVPTYIPPSDGFLNGVGSDLVDIGFAYFTNRNKAPDDYKDRLQFNFTKEHIESVKRKYNLPEKYVVMTPGSTEKPRTMKPFIFNRIISHLEEKNITPVHLGKTQINKHRKVSFEKQYNINIGLNLLDQTTLLEAAMIIQGSQCVVGLDNGLLHLGGMTTAPIVFGFTTIGPEFRSPSRPEGKTYHVYPDKEKLSCTFCMQGMRFFFNHDFKNCIYKDYKCLDAIGENNGQLWIDAIDKALKEKE